MMEFLADKHVIENNRIHCRVLEDLTIIILIVLQKTYVLEDYCCYVGVRCHETDAEDVKSSM
jgi:hypothetical protein